MRMGLVGLLLTAIGASFIALGYFFFDLSLWLVVPGVALVLVGGSLLNGANEQMLASSRHEISDRFEHNVSDNPARAKDRKDGREP